MCLLQHLTLDITRYRDFIFGILDLTNGKKADDLVTMTFALTKKQSWTSLLLEHQYFTNTSEF